MSGGLQLTQSLKPDDTREQSLSPKSKASQVRAAALLAFSRLIG